MKPGSVEPLDGVVLGLLLFAGAGDGLDLQRRPAGFFRDLAVLLDQKAVGRFVAIEAAQKLTRHLAVGALRAVLVDHVEHDEFGIQARFSWHGCSPWRGVARIEPAPMRRRVETSKGTAKSAPRANGVYIGSPAPLGNRDRARRGAAQG